MPIREWFTMIAITVAIIGTGLRYVHHAQTRWEASRLYAIENGSGPVCSYIGEELGE